MTDTHPGKSDINPETWLSLDGWNGRFQTSSGGGWMTGWMESFQVSRMVAHSLPRAWALNEDGSVNLQLLEHLASRALHKLSVLGKAITTSFYGNPPTYSYWNGCSTGVLQGLMLAQRYPDDFGGIMAAAPAISWAKFIIAEY
ncbi:hypothetical protein N7517_001494 [Penicillium concentricum]|uniref:Carboxylic ester hydrolase n=1 Tax=Penicillium concentricum TaxID=293559 RepID=A0A9W9SRW6_9EURO|nr:uncharacterized protein N7517_001494 [Penicillium concentricum]KAJ5383583.1 hypothetical protein N7517_001494 [Penicillium concentricum]